MPEKMFCLRLKSRSTSGQGKRPDTLLVFITPPTAEELERRLRGRGTETEEVIKGRMERAKEEAQGMDQYDYVLINDDLETCVKQMHETIQSQHFMSSNQKDFIEQMKKVWKNRKEHLL